ncbi:MAG: hypothetical protein HQ591_09855 [candidate division Zixibacteria bacterium]|nr:hypothetical protein [Candidatus Tariuqbacter arcticus]
MIEVHQHTGIVLLISEMVHYGKAEEVIRKRNEVLLKAFLEHQDRFKWKVPKAQELTNVVLFNSPKSEKDISGG